MAITIQHFVDGDGFVNDYGDNVYSKYGVRPALKIRNLKSSNLKIKDQFEMAGYRWTVISDEYAICNDIVGETCFRRDWRAKDVNVYEASDIKMWLADWVKDKGIEITSAE